MKRSIRYLGCCALLFGGVGCGDSTPGGDLLPANDFAAAIDSPAQADAAMPDANAAFDGTAMMTPEGGLSPDAVVTSDAIAVVDAALPVDTSAAPDLVVPVDLGRPADLTIHPDFAIPPRGMPIQAPANTWTWVDFPNSFCDDGTPTGIGVNKSSSSSNVLVFFNGGGACCNYLTCYQLNTATHGPFGATQFASYANGLATGTVFDRNSVANPFKDWSYVFIPYCTGDLHGGNAVVTYTGNGVSKTYHHSGRANAEAFVPRITGTWPSPAKVVVSGSSAGGYGAYLNYDLFRRNYPTTESYLVDDSGPPLFSSAAPGGISSCSGNWRLDLVLNPLCKNCAADPGQLAPTLASYYPRDRMALLSSEQDQTISSYLGLTPAAFQAALDNYGTSVLAPLPNFHYFYVLGSTHTMLGNTTSFTSQGVSLNAWLTKMVTDDASWVTEHP